MDEPAIYVCVEHDPALPIRDGYEVIPCEECQTPIVASSASRAVLLAKHPGQVRTLCFSCGTRAASNQTLPTKDYVIGTVEDVKVVRQILTRRWN